MQSIIVYVLGSAALILLGLVLAHWTWTWFGPRSEPRVDAALEPSGRMPSATTLFGLAQQNLGVNASAGSAIRLLGVVAAVGGDAGYAVLRLDAKEIIAVRTGDDVAPGIRLEKVFPDHVILQRSGVRETLVWPERGKSMPSLVPGAVK